jgi:hypothetical protein
VITKLLTKRRKVLLEKLIVSQLLKKFLTFCGTQRCIVVFKKDTSPTEICIAYAFTARAFKNIVTDHP